MDNDNKKNEQEFEIEIKNERVEENKLSVQEQIYEIEVKMQEIDVLIEEYEDALYNSDKEIFSVEKLNELKAEYKRLKSEKKLLAKQPKNNWDKIPVLMFIYGIFQVFFSFFYILGMISVAFAAWLMDILKESGEITEFWKIFSLFFIPFDLAFIFDTKSFIDILNTNIIPTVSANILINHPPVIPNACFI